MAKSIELLEVEYPIKPVPLAKYAEVFGRLEKIPSQFGGLESLDEESIISAIPRIISECLPEFIDIMAIATGIDKKVLDEIGMAEAVELTELVFEVNNYKYVAKTLGNIWQKKSSSPAGQTSLPLSTDGAKKKSKGQKPKS